MFVKNYKSIAMFLILLSMIFIAPQTIQAQQSDQATGQATAVIVSPLIAKQMRALRFGLLLPGKDGGNIYIDARTNQRRLSGTVSSPSNSSHRHWFGRASFLVMGEKGRNYDILMPSEINVRRFFFRVGPELTVSNLHAYSRNTEQVGNTGRLNSNGWDRLYVGGELYMPPHSRPGHYATKIDIIVAYQ